MMILFLFLFAMTFSRAGRARAEHWLRSAEHLHQGASPSILSILSGVFLA